MNAKANIVIKSDVQAALQEINKACEAIDATQRRMNAWDAAKRLDALAQRWERTTVWHEPPFLDGTIHITTGDLRDIATLVPFVRNVIEEQVRNERKVKE